MPLKTYCSLSRCIFTNATTSLPAPRSQPLNRGLITLPMPSIRTQSLRPGLPRTYQQQNQTFRSSCRSFSKVAPLASSSVHQLPEHIECHEVAFLVAPSRHIRGKRWTSISPHIERTVQVVALHGYLDNCSSFDIMVPLMLEIARENHPGISWDIVCLDAAGHGRSDYEPSGNYLLHRHVHDVFKVVQRLNFTRPHLLGHSMGASILSVLSGTFPSLPASLTFLDNYGPLALPDPDVPSNLRSYIEAHERASRKARFPTVDHAITVRSDAKALISVSPDAARILCERGLVEVRDDETGATTYSWSSDAKLMVPHAVYLCSTEAATESFLKAIQCPVRMIAGTESFYRSEQRRERVEGRIKLLAQSLGPAKFQHHLIDGTHHLHLEGTDSPRRCAELTVSFIVNSKTP